jgi:hypothetical protein
VREFVSYERATRRQQEHANTAPGKKKETLVKPVTPVKNPMPEAGESVPTVSNKKVQACDTVGEKVSVGGLTAEVSPDEPFPALLIPAHELRPGNANHMTPAQRRQLTTLTHAVDRAHGDTQIGPDFLRSEMRVRRERRMCARGE